MTRTRTATLMALALLAGPTALSGCGIPADEGPRAIPEDRAPDDNDAGVEVGGGGSAVVDLYFTRAEAQGGTVLVALEREVPTGGATVPAPATVLEALLAGPVREDRATTRIPDATALAGAPELNGAVLTIDVNDASSRVQGEGARLAFGQMVCTADALAGVEGVLLTREGEQLDAPNGDGEATTGPLTCADYAALLDDPAVLTGAGSEAPPED